MIEVVKYGYGDKWFVTDQIDKERMAAETAKGAVVEILQMSEEEYKAIPATQESHEFFK
jgi:hypothetical protein